MENLLRIGLSNAVVALVMALVVVTVACVWRRPAVLHALWLLVLVKLVTPPLVWVCVPWPIIPDSPQVAVAPLPEIAPVEPLLKEDAAIVPDSEAKREPQSADGSSNTVVSESATLPETLTRSESLAIPNAQNTTPLPIPGWIAAVCAVWLAGALAWYALALIRLWRFRRMLRHAAPAPESLRQRTQRLADKLRLRRCPGVWLVPGRVAPMLWAAGGRPRILFPADLLRQVGVEQQNALLVHELAHLRRRDHWVRWLEFAAAGLYWWNPVLWFARRELREAEEQCCDAWVTSTLPGAGKTYATALLETLDFLSDAPPATPLLASGVGRVVDLKRRLTMIMRGTTPRTLGWRGAAAVIGLGALLLPLLPAWVQAQAPTKVEKVEEGVRQPRWKLTEIHIGSDEGLDKAKAGLKQLEADLAQAQADLAQKQEVVRSLAARLEEARASVATGQAGQAFLAKARVEMAGDAVASNYDIIVKVNGDAQYTDLQDFLKQIQAVQVRGASPTVIVLDKISGKILMKLASGKTVGVDLAPAAGTQRIGPPVIDTDKRIIDLEMKLKSILNEVEQLRRERTSAAPKPTDSESKPQSNSTTPQEKLSVEYQAYKTLVPAKLPEETTVRLERLRAEAEREKAQAAALAAAGDARQRARAAALAAELDASQARIKMLEDEIAKLKNTQGNKEPAKP